MDKKVIMITGASSGMGKDMAEYFSGLGYKVYGIARNGEILLEMRNCLGDNFFGISYDLADTEGMEKIFSVIKEQGEKLDGIIHCAGLTANTPIRVNETEELEAILRVNFEALVQLVKYASGKKYTNEGASIIAMSSTASYVGCKGNSAYAASKAAVNSFVKSASTELVSRKIRINAIAPSMVKTKMYEQTIAEIPEMEDAVNQNQPLGIIEPRDISYLAEFLMSDRAKYITGAIIPIGAGHTIW